MLLLTANELLRKIKALRVWQKGDKRAPHKPLLILYALGRLQRGDTGDVLFTQAQPVLQHLLDEFGPPRRSTPVYPFYHLQNDGIWQLHAGKPDAIIKPTAGCLNGDHVSGGFTPEVQLLLQQYPQLIEQVAVELLMRNFPETVHDDVLAAVGLDLTSHQHPQRAADFRDRVLRAYEYRCAVCGFNVWLDQTLVAVEAAHIKWHQAGGPDNESNGVALCALHHKLYDRGVFTISNELRITVSEAAHGNTGFHEWLMQYANKDISSPLRPEYYPNPTFISWHIREVFRGPSRYVQAITH